MEHLGSIIWIVVVIVAVISSMISSIRKSAAARDGQPQPTGVAAPQPGSLPQRISHQAVPPESVLEPVRMPQPVAPQRVVTLAPSVVIARASEPVMTPPPPMVASAPPREIPPVLPPLPAHDLPAARTGQIRLNFEQRGTWVRAIIAAEILGPPISLREQSFWSQRHNEPSI